MKKFRLHIIILSLCLFVVALSTSSCLRKRPDYGKLVTRNIPVKAFDEVEITGNASATLVQGKEYKVVVKAPAKVQSLIDVSATKGKLLVKEGSFSMKNIFVFSRNTSPMASVEIVVTVPSVKKITVSSNADLDINDRFKVDSLEINVLGNANCNIKQLLAKQVKAGIMGNGSADFTYFNVKTSSFYVIGNGSINVNYVGAERSKVFTSGNGSADLRGDVAQGVNTNVQGNGSVQNKVKTSDNK